MHAVHLKKTSPDQGIVTGKRRSRERRRIWVTRGTAETTCSILALSECMSQMAKLNGSLGGGGTGEGGGLEGSKATLPNSGHDLH
eukprot:1146111-Pelagomonas_calceolata.AAC.2